MSHRCLKILFLVRKTSKELLTKHVGIQIIKTEDISHFSGTFIIL